VSRPDDTLTQRQVLTLTQLGTTSTFSGSLRARPSRDGLASDEVARNPKQATLQQPLHNKPL